LVEKKLIAAPPTKEELRSGNQWIKRHLPDVRIISMRQSIQFASRSELDKAFKEYEANLSTVLRNKERACLPFGKGTDPLPPKGLHSLRELAPDPLPCIPLGNAGKRGNMQGGRGETCRGEEGKHAGAALKLNAKNQSIRAFKGTFQLTNYYEREAFFETDIGKNAFLFFFVVSLISKEHLILPNEVAVPIEPSPELRDLIAQGVVKNLPGTVYEFLNRTPATPAVAAAPAPSKAKAKKAAAPSNVDETTPRKRGRKPSVKPGETPISWSGDDAARAALFYQIQKGPFSAAIPIVAGSTQKAISEASTASAPEAGAEETASEAVENANPKGKEGEA
jgi:hypothetical protein